MCDNYKTNGYKFSFNNQHQDYFVNTPKFISRQFKHNQLRNQNHQGLTTNCSYDQTKNNVKNVKKNIRKKLYQLEDKNEIENNSNLINLKQSYTSQRKSDTKQMRIKKMQFKGKNIKDSIKQKVKTVPIQQQRSLIQLWDLNQIQRVKFHPHRFCKSSKTLNIRSQNNQIKSSRFYLSKHTSRPRLQEKYQKSLINPNYLLANFYQSKVKTSKISILKQASNKLKKIQKLAINKKKTQKQKIKNQISHDIPFNKKIRHHPSNKKIQQMLKYNVQHDFVYIQT